jgi:hypothetical protein
MDFGSAVQRGTQIGIVSRCVFANGQAANIQPMQMKRTLLATIPITEMMPREAFFYEPFANFRSIETGMPISCSFDFTALGPDGESTHHFDFMVQNYFDTGASIHSLLRRNSEVLDVTWGPDTIAPQNKAWNIPVILESQLPSVSLTFRQNVTADQAELRCRGFEPNVVSVGQNYLPLTRFIWNEDTPEHKGQRLVQHLCRIIGFTANGVTAASPYFYFRPDPPPALNVVSVPTSVSDINGYFGHTFEFQRTVLTNTSAQNIQIRLPKGSLVTVFVLASDGVTMNSQLFNANVFGDSVPPGGTFTLPPGSSVGLHQTIDLSLRCNSSDQPPYREGLILAHDGQTLNPEVIDAEGSVFQILPIFGSNDIGLRGSLMSIGHPRALQPLENWRQRHVNSSLICH